MEKYKSVFTSLAILFCGVFLLFSMMGVLLLWIPFSAGAYIAAVVIFLTVYGVLLYLGTGKIMNFIMPVSLLGFSLLNISAALSKAYYILPLSCIFIVPLWILSGKKKRLNIVSVYVSRFMKFLVVVAVLFAWLGFLIIGTAPSNRLILPHKSKSAIIKEKESRRGSEIMDKLEYNKPEQILAG